MARVLVVDDQRIPRLAVSAILAEAGHEVRAEESGADGIRAAGEWGPDVVVLDVYMPEMDGFDVVRRLKEDPDTAPTPVIFLTAEPPSDDLIVRGLDLGAYDFLGKDCSRAELLARVGAMSRIKRANDELSAIARISDTLIQSLDPQEMSRHFVRQIAGVFRAQAVLLSYHGDATDPGLSAGVGIETDDPLAEPLREALLQHLEDSGAEVAEIPVTSLRGGAGVLARRHDLVCAVATRVMHEGRPPTLLAILTEREDGFLRGSDAPLLHLLARQATIALDNASLHAQTRQQAIAMERQAEALERAISERSRFFASMSHELRTPINAVIGYSELLQFGTYGELSDEQLTAVKSVSRSAQHLLELINDVLDISKIEAGKLEVSWDTVRLGELLHDTATSLQIQAAQKGLSLSIDAPDSLELRTDPARVRQIMLNLLSNAVKFTDDGGVSVVVVPPGDASGAEVLEIRVSDTGPGIEPEDQARIFEEFEQTQATRGRGGTGLGLPISRRLAHLLGGNLSLESEPGVGSTFVLRLPRTAEVPDPADAVAD